MSLNATELQGGRGPSPSEVAQPVSHDQERTLALCKRTIVIANPMAMIPMSSAVLRCTFGVPITSREVARCGEQVHAAAANQ